MKDDIAVLYESMLGDRTALITEIDELDTTTTDGQSETDTVQVVNIYIKPSEGPIQRPYTGEVVNSTRIEGSFTYIAKDSDNNKIIQVIMLDDGEISVNIQDSEGRLQDTFLGKDLDFYDIDDEQTELNIIKIESV